jgi:transposase-like protein
MPSSSRCSASVQAVADQLRERFPKIAAAWGRNWEQVIPFFAYPPEVCRIIYTTDEIDKRVGRERISGARVTAGRSAARRLQALPRSQVTQFASDLRHPCSSPWVACASAQQTGRRNARPVRPWRANPVGRRESRT